MLLLTRRENGECCALKRKDNISWFPSAVFMNQQRVIMIFFHLKKMPRGKHSMHPMTCSTNLEAPSPQPNTENQSDQFPFEKLHEKGIL